MLAPVLQASAASPQLKTFGSETRTTAQQHVVGHIGEIQEGQGPAGTPTVGLSASTALANVNAVAATAGNRTVLQLLAFAIALQMNMSRSGGEALDAFFQRLAAGISNMKDPDKAALELKTGLKALGINLADLAAALRSPEGTMAARIVALAEAPRASLAKTAAMAATNNYLQGTQTAPQAVEDFSIGAAIRNADGAAVNQPVERGHARGLQSHLQEMFEPGAAISPDADFVAALPMEVEEPLSLEIEERVLATGSISTADQEVESTQAKETQAPMATTSDDEPALLAEGEEIGETATLVVETTLDEGTHFRTTQSAEAKPGDRLQSVPLKEEVEVRAEEPEPFEGAVDKPSAVRQDSKQVAAPVNGRRLETMLVLKGLAEVVQTVDEQPDHIVSQPDPTDPYRRRAADHESPRAIVSESLLKIEKAVASATEALDRLTRQAVEPLRAEDVDAEDPSKTAGFRPETVAQQAAASAEVPQAARSALQPEYVPFAFAPALPARDAFKAGRAEEDGRRDDDAPEDQAEDQETPEDRRERLARRETDDLLDGDQQEVETIPITRDSSDSDRAYAMYQRMSGF